MLLNVGQFAAIMQKTNSADYLQRKDFVFKSWTVERTYSAN